MADGQVGYISQLIYTEEVTAREIIRKLQAHGWTERRHGKHLIMGKEDRICPIPLHGKRDLAIGTLRKIEAITGVKLT